MAEKQKNEKTTLSALVVSSLFWIGIFFIGHGTTYCTDKFHVSICFTNVIVLNSSQSDLIKIYNNEKFICELCFHKKGSKSN